MRERIFFDCVGLLFDCEFNEDTLLRAHKLVKKHLDNLGKPVNLESLRRASFDVANRYFEDNRRGFEWPIERIVTGIFRELKLEITSRDLEIVSAIYKINNHNSFPRKGVVETIPELARKYSLGIISNSTHDSLVHELGAYNLVQYFDPIVFSFQVGVRKPNPLIYEVALLRAQASPGECLFVSHDENELMGAEKSGMKTYLINDENERSFEDLPGLKWQR